MKRRIKNIIPIRILDWYGKLKYRRNTTSRSKDHYMDRFQSIYKSNSWGNKESVSGQGSSAIATERIIKGLNSLFKEFSISSICDVPCGDFNWMSKVQFPKKFNYIGGDIINSLVQKNQEKYGCDKILFMELDLIEDEIPKSDLILVRDCFVHFSYHHIRKSIENIKASGSKYLLTTTFTDCKLNYDIRTGDWRPINLQRKPFRFPEPILVITENISPRYKKDFRGKSLALWSIDEL